MKDIVTFGSAAWDVFMKIENFESVKNKQFISKTGICFNLGSKIDIDEIYFSSGGGGTNSAVTFANQGLKASFLGKVGCDLAGGEIVKELNEYGVNTSLIFKTDRKPTNYSVIFKAKKDRTILVFRGASELLDRRDIPFEKIKTKWFYLAPLSGNLAKLTKNIINFAYRNNIKIAFNPGIEQLSLPKKELDLIISKVDVLLLNQEEASSLAGIDYHKEEDIFKKIDDMCHGIVVMTKGSEGVTVSDGKHLFGAPGSKGSFVDNTGAGDAFGSGFVAGLIKSKWNIEKAIQLGMGNSISSLGEWGAKKGLLKRGQRFKKVKVSKEACLGHNCKNK
jgi:sugar/nucleoside kinase (ribokinase family)